MKILAGGPARTTEGHLFRAHIASLYEQQGDWSVQVHHDVTPDPGGPRWEHEKIERVAEARQRVMEDAQTYDGLFFVDTDVILGPGVLERLLEVDAPVVYGVFWTYCDWGGPVDWYPQVWDISPYGWTPETADALRKDGVNEVEVYGGGACTLIRGRGFESHYWPLLDSLKPYASIMNQKSLWAGEDRTFGLGCELRGIRQVAVTGLKIHHCYTLPDQTKPALERIREEVGL